MNVLLIGSGGREHAIAKKIVQSKKIKKFYAIPGNPGIAEIAEIIDIKQNNYEKIIDFSIKNNIDIIICGPEQPLVDGIADMADNNSILVFGPKKAGAMLEGSKIYSKKFMANYNIPTSGFKTFDQSSKASEYINTIKNYPVVIKADGLAAGKGVKIAANKNEAHETIKEYMDDKIFGESGNSILIEEFLQGEEMSFLFITDGKTFIPLIPAKDYKKALNNNEGENTGGMGCYAPHHLITDDLKYLINNEIISKIKDGFEKEDIDYKGVLYVGLMLTDKGPQVLEFNCRFGDPETQVILPLIESDLLQVMYDTAKGNLKYNKINWKEKYAACVVMASSGYPKVYEKGKLISFKSSPFDYIHAGTKKKNKQFFTNGGRVLNAVALGDNKDNALKNAYSLINNVDFEGAFYRTDIGS